MKRSPEFCALTKGCYCVSDPSGTESIRKDKIGKSESFQSGRFKGVCKQGGTEKCVSEGVEFDITEDDSLKENQCIIETDQRIIDCSLDVQLQNLKDQIKMLTIM